MLLWAVWNTRNNIVWNGDSFDPVQMYVGASKLLDEFQKFHPLQTKRKIRKVVRWRCPPSGRLKINVDGSFLVDKEKGGVGVVIRNENGECVAAFARSMFRSLSALQTEAEACRAGLLIAIHQGWTDIEVESDCAVVVSAVANTLEDYSDVSRIIEDCKTYLRSFNSVSIRHINREANGVANRFTTRKLSFYRAQFTACKNVRRN